MSEANELIQQETTAAPGTGPVTVVEHNPLSMISAAIANGTDASIIDRLLTMEREHHAEQARREFFQAMASAKANFGVVRKSGVSTQHGVHATLHDVITAVTPALSTEGLSLSWPVNQSEGGITVSCVISHRDGHCSDPVSLTAPADTSGSKNAVQAIGSTVHYWERYTAIAALGLSATDVDDDAAHAIDSYEDVAQALTALELSASYGMESLEKDWSEIPKAIKAQVLPEKKRLGQLAREADAVPAEAP